MTNHPRSFLYDARQRVLEFVAAESGANAASITMETTLFGDLQLYGEHCEHFLRDFAEHFGVSFDGFDFSRYFPPEPYLGPGLLKAMFRRMRTSDPHAVSRVDPVRIADLVRWVECGFAPHAGT